MIKFADLKEGDRVKTKLSGMATVIGIGYAKGKMVKLNCDKKKWSCPYFYESELDLNPNKDEDISKNI